MFKRSGYHGLGSWSYRDGHLNSSIFLWKFTTKKVYSQLQKKKILWQFQQWNLSSKRVRSQTTFRLVKEWFYWIESSTRCMETECVGQTSSVEVSFILWFTQSKQSSAFKSYNTRENFNLHCLILIILNLWGRVETFYNKARAWAYYNIPVLILALHVIIM